MLRNFCLPQQQPLRKTNSSTHIIQFIHFLAARYSILMRFAGKLYNYFRMYPQCCGWRKLWGFAKHIFIEFHHFTIFSSSVSITPARRDKTTAWAVKHGEGAVKQLKWHLKMLQVKFLYRTVSGVWEECNRIDEIEWKLLYNEFISEALTYLH